MRSSNGAAPRRPLSQWPVSQFGPSAQSVGRERKRRIRPRIPGPRIDPFGRPCGRHKSHDGGLSAGPVLIVEMRQHRLEKATLDQVVATAVGEMRNSRRHALRVRKTFGSFAPLSTAGHPTSVNLIGLLSVPTRSTRAPLRPTRS